MSSEIHITPDLLEAVESGEVPARVLTEVGWKHLQELCPTCREGFRSWKSRRRAATEFHYDRTFRVLPWLLNIHLQSVRKKNEQEERDLGDLLEWPQPERLGRIQRAVTRFRGVGLAHRLVDEARSGLPAQADRVYELAEAAEHVLLRTPASPGYWGAMARARAYKANAVRACGQLKEAESRLASARALLQQEQAAEPLAHAEVDAFEGVLRKDQHRFDEAEVLLGRSAELFELIGEPVESAKPLLALGLLHFERQEFDKALASTRGALARINPDAEPRLYLCGRHNLALFLLESGEHQAATDLLQTDGPLYARFADPWTSLRRRWMAGKIAYRDSRMEDAESDLIAVREEFLEKGIGYDAAMVALDLARLYLQEGRTAEVRRLVDEARVVLEAQKVHPAVMTALAALSLQCALAE